MLKKALVYVAVIALFVAGVVGILHVGSRQQSAHPPQAVPGQTGGGSLQSLYENLQHPLNLLLLQIVVIVVAARVMGALARRAGQPAVIGEMVAGIILGPSLLGVLWRESQPLLFPPASLGALRLLSQIGVILFMFLVGMGLDVAQLRRKVHAAIWVSHASIILPFFLGTALSLFLYRPLAPAGVTFSAFGLFMGTAMSITAFPVLARIIEERGLAGSALGSTAIACAAVDDATAWCVLALVVAIARAHAVSGAALTLLLSLAFIALVVFVVKPWAARILGEELRDEARATGLFAGVLSFVFVCALATELIGIHALFGAFLAGVAVPRAGTLRESLKKRLDVFTSAFLLPLFFAFTGLRTQVGLLDDLRSWLMCLGVIAVAVSGKLVGSLLAARAAGMSWRDSFALGALMNTRGLVELIVLNVGYDLGILSPRIFTMMVLMALTTTLMTGPLLSLAEWSKRRELEADAADGAVA
jgi:Kef-type K+ transport system membrane component KefB